MSLKAELQETQLAVVSDQVGRCPASTNAKAGILVAVIA